jgi:hypothetical protein
MPRKVFTAGEVLAAADVNEFLMDQTVMTFAGTAARGSAIGTAVEGMVAYLNDSNTLSIYDGSAWKTSLRPTGGILQVVSTTKTDTFTSATSGFVDITGLSVSITPSSASNKILIYATVNWNHSNDANATGLLKLTGGNTSAYIGDSASSRTPAASGARFSSAFAGLTTGWTMESSLNYLDSPATTSPISYQVQIFRDTGTVYVNRNADDSDIISVGRFASTITAFEVAS